MVENMTATHGHSPGRTAIKTPFSFHFLFYFLFSFSFSFFPSSFHILFPPPFFSFLHPHHTATSHVTNHCCFTQRSSVKDNTRTHTRLPSLSHSLLVSSQAITNYYSSKLRHKATTALTERCLSSARPQQ